MAGRPNKIGLNYFPTNCDLMDTDEMKLLFQKVKKITNGNGHIAYTFYNSIIGKIYGGKGYYIEITDDLAGIMVSGYFFKDIDQFYKIIDCAIELRFFNPHKYSQYRVLTSEVIQSQYIHACEGRKIRLLQDYLLLTNPQKESSSARTTIEIVGRDGVTVEGDKLTGIDNKTDASFFCSNQKTIDRREIPIDRREIESQNNLSPINTNLSPINTNLSPINTNLSPINDTYNNKENNNKKNKLLSGESIFLIFAQYFKVFNAKPECKDVFLRHFEAYQKELARKTDTRKGFEFFDNPYCNNELHGLAKKWLELSNGSLPELYKLIDDATDYKSGTKKAVYTAALKLPEEEQPPDNTKRNTGTAAIAELLLKSIAGKHVRKENTYEISPFRKQWTDVLLDVSMDFMDDDTITQLVNTCKIVEANQEFISLDFPEELKNKELSFYNQLMESFKTHIYTHFGENIAVKFIKKTKPNGPII